MQEYNCERDVCMMTKYGVMLVGNTERLIAYIGNTAKGNLFMCMDVW